MSEFTTSVDSSKGKVDWFVINTKDLLPTEIQALIDSATQIKTALETFWLVQKAEMLLANAEAVVTTGISALSLVKAIANSLVGVLANLADISFMELFLPPEKGGFNKFINRFKYHLFDSSDPNRPADDGNAYLLPIMMMVSFKDLTRAREAFANIEKLWGKFKTEGDDLVKALKKSIPGFAPEPDATEPEGFWKHYYQKRLVGSRETPKSSESWHKQNILKLFPESEMRRLQGMLDSWGAAADGSSKQTDLVEKTGETVTFMLSIVDEVVIALDAYSKLFTDNQLTIVKLPGITGEAITSSKDYSLNADIYKIMRPSSITGRKTATEILGEFSSTLPNLMKDASKNLEQGGYNLGFANAEQLELLGAVQVDNPFNASGAKKNYTNFLREDYNVGGVVMVFKGPSLSLLTEQVNAFLGMWGIS